jgi:hypothetical protein
MSRVLEPSPVPMWALVLPRAERLWTPPRYPEGSSATMHSSALDPASLLRRDLALTCVLQLQTTPASVEGSSANMCPKALQGLWDVEIKEGLAPTACSEAHVFPRHARVLLRHLQDLWAEGIIMTSK